jgi:hypothetical protein
VSGGGQFLGAWRVREYVFSPSGAPLGVVDQRRHLERAPGDRIRVIQDCSPEASLASHAMGRFAGHHEFELSVDGRARRYHGPAVLGTGMSYGEGAMLGRGVWPVFGHNFTSFAVLVEPGRQLTGGRFFRASEMVANIAGVAANEADGVVPHLAGPSWPGEIARGWSGTLRGFSPDGTPLDESPLRRRYDGDRGFHEQGSEGVQLRFDPEGGGHYRVVGGAHGRPMLGLAKAYGWLLDVEAVLGPESMVEWMEMLDAVGGHLIGFRRVLVDHAVKRVEVMRLSPESRSPHHG